jgi:uncharacterized protein YjbI with pentapeptide repeats
MEVLTAFLRENAGWRKSLTAAEKRSAEERSSELGDRPVLRFDLQAAATVVARRDLRAEFAGGSCARAAFAFANLGQTVLSTSTDWTGAVFIEANLTGSFIPGRLEGLDFSCANLTGADLSRSTMVGVDFGAAELTGANLSGADLREAVDLASWQVDDAITDENTQLPPNLAESPAESK